MAAITGSVNNSAPIGQTYGIDHSPWWSGPLRERSVEWQEEKAKGGGGGGAGCGRGRGAGRGGGGVGRGGGGGGGEKMREESGGSWCAAVW